MSNMTKEKIFEVMKAFSEGKKIEYSSPSMPNLWYDVDASALVFDFMKYDFRVKPKEEFQLHSVKERWKIVNYFGVKLRIPEEVNYIATDNDGGVWGFCREPWYNKETDSWNSDFSYRELGTKASFSGDCADSLMRIN